MLDRLKNFAWLGLEDTVRLVLGFVVTLMLARYLGPASFGAYGYLFGLVALLVPLVLFGLDPIVAKLIAGGTDRVGTVIATATALRMITALVSVALLWLTMRFMPEPPGTSIYLAGVAAITVVSLPLQSVNIYFKAVERPRFVALPRVAITILSFLAMLLLIKGGADLAGFLWLRAIEATVMALVAIIGFLLWQSPSTPLCIDYRILKQFVRQGTPLMLSGLAGVIYMRIDQVMLGQLSSVEELGQYTIAVRFSDSVFFVPMALQAAFLPALVRAKAKGNAAYREEMRSFFAVMAMAMSAAALTVGVLSAVAINIFLGPSYSASIPMVWILALGLPFVGLGVARSAYLNIENWFWTAPLTTALGALVNVALNFVLIPSLGGVGAAITSVLSYWIAAHGSCFLLPWLRPIGYEITRTLNPISLAARVLMLSAKVLRQGRAE